MKFFIALALTLTLACGGRDESATQTDTSATTTTSATSVATQTETSATTDTSATTETLAPAPTPVGAEPVAGPKLAPVDQASTDPTFVAYRDKLRAAVKSRDAKAVVALSDPKIRTSFGDGGGTSALQKALARPGVWDELDSVLAHGGSFLGEGETKSFWAPYVYSAWPEEKDVFTHFAVIGENVPLRKSADANAEVIASLSHDIVERATPGPDKGDWRHVKTADGRTGYVAAKDVHGPVGYRAGFLKQNGEWKMNAFVAGD
ncbi:MAG TPA: SH3 domain-containing protein [Thermoanaerobaculia bacterium]